MAVNGKFILSGCGPNYYSKLIKCLIFGGMGVIWVSVYDDNMLNLRYSVQVVLSS